MTEQNSVLPQPSWLFQQKDTSSRICLWHRRVLFSYRVVPWLTQGGGRVVVQTAAEPGSDRGQAGIRPGSGVTQSVFSTPRALQKLIFGPTCTMRCGGGVRGNKIPWGPTNTACDGEYWLRWGIRIARGQHWASSRASAPEVHGVAHPDMQSFASLLSILSRPV